MKRSLVYEVYSNAINLLVTSDIASAKQPLFTTQNLWPNHMPDHGYIVNMQCIYQTVVDDPVAEYQVISGHRKGKKDR